jgi:hypothetical protein
MAAAGGVSGFGRSALAACALKVATTTFFLLLECFHRGAPSPIDLRRRNMSRLGNIEIEIELP